MKTNISSSASALSKLMLLALLTFAGFSLHAQTTNKNVVTDTTEVIVGNKVITITIDTLTGKKDVQVTSRVVDHEFWDENESEENDGDSNIVKPVDVHFLGIDLGANWMLYNNSFNVPNSLSQYETEPLRSTNVALHLLPTHFNMLKGHVSVLTAVTFDNNRYQFRNNVTMLPGQDTVTLVPDSASFKKNKLNTWYAQIPLLLSFQTNPTNQKKNFHIAFGGFAGLFLGANTKQKSEERGKVILKDDFNLNPFRYGVTARIGYGNLELYSTYTLTPTFRENQAPNFNTITFGIALTGLM